VVRGVKWHSERKGSDESTVLYVGCSAFSVAIYVIVLGHVSEHLFRNMETSIRTIYYHMSNACTFLYPSLTCG
jgi:hypothetical protein